METYVIVRVVSTIDGIAGMFMHEYRFPICNTLELPWKDNAHNISCIPPTVIVDQVGGRTRIIPDYICLRTVSPNGIVRWEVTGVEGRSSILIHGGNTIEDTEGCIILAEKFDVVGARNGVLESTEAYDEFMAVTAGEKEMRLRIIDTTGVTW
jgi:hypothetical protein